MTDRASYTCNRLRHSCRESCCKCAAVFKLPKHTVRDVRQRNLVVGVLRYSSYFGRRVCGLFGLLCPRRHSRVCFFRYVLGMGVVCVRFSGKSKRGRLLRRVIVVAGMVCVSDLCDLILRVFQRVFPLMPLVIDTGVYPVFRTPLCAETVVCGACSVTKESNIARSSFAVNGDSGLIGCLNLR